MEVSVVIPLYNKAAYIRRAIDSVLLQTFQDFELIVVDDGSMDTGPELVAAYQNPRIRLFSQPNSGPGAARNLGIRNANADLIAFLDADDEWLPGYLEKAVGYLMDNKDVATISLGYRIADEPEEAVTSLWNARGLVDGRYRVIAENYSAQFAVWLLGYMSPCSTMARKTVLLKYGGFFDKWRCLYAEDAYLWLQVLLNETVAVSREIHVIFHREASGLSNCRLYYPTEPFLREPEGIYRNCPPEGRRLLEEILAIRATNTASHYALAGLGSTARRLLARFCRNYKPERYYKTLLYATISEWIPELRSYWRALKRLKKMLAK